MKTTIPIRLLDIEHDGFHLLISVSVNGKKLNALIDTGASRTVFDLSRMREIFSEMESENFNRLTTGIGTDSMESHVTVFYEMQLGEILFKKYQAVLLDMKHVNISYGNLGHAPIDGVIGGDLLYSCKAVIDYGNSVLHLTDPLSS